MAVTRKMLRCGELFESKIYQAAPKAKSGGGPHARKRSQSSPDEHLRRGKPLRHGVLENVGCAGHNQLTVVIGLILDHVAAALFDAIALDQHSAVLGNAI